MLSVLTGSAGKCRMAAIYARATSWPVLQAAWWSAAVFSPVHLSACFMVYSCGEKHSVTGPDLFPFLMFLLGWINTSTKKEGTSHAGDRKSGPPVLGWEHSPKELSVVTTSAIVKSSSDFGFRSPSVGSRVPNQRTLSQYCPQINSLLVEFINTCS